MNKCFIIFSFTIGMEYPLKFLYKTLIYNKLNSKLTKFPLYTRKNLIFMQQVHKMRLNLMRKLGNSHKH